MTKEKAYSKEIDLLLRRHNKVAKVKLKECDYDIPEDILVILCQTGKRKAEQTAVVESFRQRAIEELLVVSEKIHQERLEKGRKTREANLQKNPNYVKHFGEWVDLRLKSANIRRDSYAIINKKSTVMSYGLARMELERDKNFPVYVDDDTLEVFYTDEYCIKYREECLKNFDINMNRFSELDSDEFNAVLKRFVKGRHFEEVFSLDEDLCNPPEEMNALCAGYVYIMVLDKFKQAYIGITTRTVKQRIKQHWKKQCAFDRLLFGPVERSKLSIDSFGALDTSRIFVKPYFKTLKTPIELYEIACIKAFERKYLLNRI